MDNSPVAMPPPYGYLAKRKVEVNLKNLLTKKEAGNEKVRLVEVVEGIVRL